MSNINKYHHNNSYDLFDSFFDNFFAPSTSNLMRCDITDEGDHYNLTIEVPSVKKENIKLSLEDGYLTINAVFNDKEDENKNHGKYIRHERRYSELSRSFTSEIPISGRVSNGLLILTNERPDRNITFTLADSEGSIIIRKEIPQENTSYMVIPLDGLQEGETYTVTLTSPYPVDCLTGIVNF